MFPYPPLLLVVGTEKILKRAAGQRIEKFALDKVEVKIRAGKVKRAIVVDYINPQYRILYPEGAVTKGVVQFVPSGTGKEAYLRLTGELWYLRNAVLCY